MIIAIDVGNTNVVIGGFEKEELKWKWRISSHQERTPDEWWFFLKEIILNPPEGVIISSVVPNISKSLKKCFENHYGVSPLFLAPGIKTGLPILYDPPTAVGADRIANAVGGIKKYGAPLIIVDFGTAITFDVISEKKEYLGGLIFPGISTASEALFKSAAKLPKVELSSPEGEVIGRNTISSIKNGIFYGFKAMVDGTIRELKKSIKNPRVIATGGEGEEISSASQEIEAYDGDLTLIGLKNIYELNK